MASSTSNAASTKKTKLVLLGMFVLGILPFLAAYVVYHTGWGIPSGRTNHGQLIQPPVNFFQLPLVDNENKQVDSHTWKNWLLVTVDDGQCEEACQKAVYDVRQINIALGKNTDRVQQVYVSINKLDNATKTLFDKDYPKLKVIYTQENAWLSGWDKALPEKEALDKHFIFIVDPLGNAVMYFTPAQNPKDILDDLNKLLKYSTIG